MDQKEKEKLMKHVTFKVVPKGTAVIKADDRPAKVDLGKMPL